MTTPKRRTIAKPAAAEVPAKLKLKIAEYYRTKKESNALVAREKKQRKELLALMNDLGMKDASVLVDIDGKKVSLSAVIAAAQRQTVDVEKLSSLVDMKTLLGIVSASQVAVDSAVGSHITAQCLVSSLGETNVSVNPTKG